MRAVELVLGKPLAEADAASIRGLVDGSVREQTFLDYKQELYGRSERDKHSLASDIAAMANTIDGVIILGVEDVNSVATSLMPVRLSGGEEQRMRQIVASLVAPVPQFAIYPVEESPGTDVGFYVIAIPRSPDAPHAVRVGEGLRYPRRDGTTTRYLSESEVADAYRNRFQQAASQVERLAQIANEGISSLEPSIVWIAVAMVPISPGHMELRQRTIDEAQSWVRRWLHAGFGSTVFGSARLDVSAGVGRIIVSTRPLAGTGQRSDSGHAELYQDGGGFAATKGFTPHFQSELPGVTFVNDDYLVDTCLSVLRLLLEHAIQRTGAVGDAICEARIVVPGNQVCRLIERRSGFADVVEGSRDVEEFPVVRHQLNLGDCETAIGALIAVRMLLTNFFQAFGIAEVPQVTASGALRRRYFMAQTQRMILDWAAQHNVEVVDSSLDAEP